MKKTILLLLATFAIIIAGNHVVNAQNMLTNPGFEDWTAGAPGPPDSWDVYGGNISASQEAVIIHGGLYSTNITWTNTSTVQLEQVTIPVTGGNSYQFSFWAFDNDPGGRVRVTVRWFDVDTNFIAGYYGDYTTDSPDWQLMSSGSQEAPLEATLASVEVRAYDVSAGWTGSATVYVDDALFEDVTTASAVILNAYAVSATAVDVVYDKAITSVNNADFTLTGSASITFSSATIDGTNPKIVHLTGASAAMASDITLDNIEDLDNGSNYDFYAGIMPISFTNTNNPTGTMINGYTATFQGIISANDVYQSVWVSDAAGQFNGVMIFDYDFWVLVDVGDEIIFYAQRAIFSTLTELVDPVLISGPTSGNTPYGPSIINGSDIDYLIAADTDPAEPWEGQLVKIETFTVDSLDGFTYWCSWSDAKADYIFKMGDNVDYHLLNTLVNVGQTYPSITGVVDWDYYNDYYRINPRNQYDIEGSIAPATQLAIVSVNGGSDPEENLNFSVVVQAWDVLGNPTLADGDINFTFTTNGGDLSNVGFVGITTGTILSGTSEITVTGVQMTPAGDNVTITANDDATVLISGTSAPFNVTEGLSYIIYQGFETSGDTWNYTADPLPYNVSGDVWDAVSSLSAISPAAGDLFWGMQDLDNGAGGGPFWHTIDFDPVDVSLYAGVELSFQYYTIAFDSLYGDTLAYVVEYDNGTSWGDPVILISNTGGWAQVNLPIPIGTNYVRLRLQARQNGGGDYAGFDDVKMIETASNPPTKLAILSVNGGNDPYDNTDFEVVVQTQTASGSPAAVSADLNFTLNSESGTVYFVPGTDTTGTITAGTSAIVLSGIQMAPTGTNVTITAGDDNPFGLLNGTSTPFDVIHLPDLMITEIMPDPSAVSDTDGEWFEIFNNGALAVDLLGYVIKDDGTDSHTIGASVVVSPGGFVTLGRNAISSENGNYTCDYQYSSFILGNGDDEVILCLPDGLTEIDRVEYDGGFLWPDPTATSMVFAGFSSDDNNDGSNWVKPYRREFSFVDAGDNGSPGSNGYQQLLTGGFKLNLNAYLEGPYDTDLDMMDGSIFLPMDQPYDTVPYYGNLTPNWLYTGSERFNNFSGSQTDWVLVELRDATTAAGAGSGTTIDSRPAMLLDDGSIVCLNGVSDLSLNLSVSNNLFIVIWHRNHLGIMSATGLTPAAGSSATYDFTTGSDKVYGGATGYVELEAGVWGMATGDVNADGTIDINDKADGWSTDTGMSGYLGGDLDFSGQSNNQDKNDYWLPNVVTTSQVPN